MNKLLSRLKLSLIRSLVAFIGKQLNKALLVPEPVLARAQRRADPARRQARVIDGEFRRLSEPKHW